MYRLNAFRAFIFVQISVRLATAIGRSKSIQREEEERAAEPQQIVWLKPQHLNAKILRIVCSICKTIRWFCNGILPNDILLNYIEFDPHCRNNDVNARYAVVRRLRPAQRRAFMLLKRLISPVKFKFNTPKASVRALTGRIGSHEQRFLFSVSCRRVCAWNGRKRYAESSFQRECTRLFVDKHSRLFFICFVYVLSVYYTALLQ